jgi:hypothetical protein
MTKCESFFAPSLVPRSGKFHPARKPSAGAMPGRCGFCSRGKTHRPTSIFLFREKTLSRKTLVESSSTAQNAPAEVFFHDPMSILDISACSDRLEAHEIRIFFARNR